MKQKLFQSRRLFLLLAFLLFDSDSYFYSFIPTSKSNKSTKGSESVNFEDVKSLLPDQDVAWILDDSTGHCLGIYGFGECGDLNQWKVDRFGGEVQFHPVLNDHFHANQTNNLGQDCLARSRNVLKKRELLLRKCSESRLSSTWWKIDESTGMLSTSGATSSLFGPACVINEETRPILQPCRRGFTAIKVVPLADNLHSSIKNAEVLTNSANNNLMKNFDQGEWRCPVTGLTMPRNLDSLLPPLSLDQRQVLMGAGIFTKVRLISSYTLLTFLSKRSM